VSSLVRLEGVRWTADAGLPSAREVLRGVDLGIGERERVAVVGRSGAGKTTLVTILAGLLEPTAGRVVTAGGVAPEPGEIGLVFQEPERAFFEETVLEDVAFGPRNRGAPPDAAREMAREALRTVGLDPDDLGPRAPETLSGGEARRAAIAGVIAMEPRLLVFDEPTTGLDADGLDRFRGILASLRGKGLAYVLVSHDLELVVEECERVIVLEDGAVLFDGDAHRIPEGLPEDWRGEPASWGGEIAVIAEAVRGRGWIGEGVSLEPSALAAVLASHLGGRAP